MTNLYEMTGSLNVGEALDVIHLHFSKPFDLVSHCIPASKLRKYGLGEWTLKWIEK